MTDRRKERGLFERPTGSGVWWIRCCDQYGRLHREKVGPKKLAKEIYRKRKTEIREGKSFPEQLSRKREVLFEAAARGYVERPFASRLVMAGVDLYTVKELCSATKPW